MTAPIMKHFQFAHLPEKLQEVSKPIGELAQQLDESLPDGAEKSAGLRKLLEAKDCFVRAALPLLLLMVASLAFAQGPIMHGQGDPRIQIPVPNCEFSRFYIDDSNQRLYIAQQGSPCAWSPSDQPSYGSGLNVQTFPLPTSTAFGSASLQPSANNPVAGNEFGNTVFILAAGCIRFNYNGNPLTYQFAPGPSCETWSSPVNVSGMTHGWYGSVANIGGTYYAVGGDAQFATNIYLYQLSGVKYGAAPTATVMNGGSPVFTKSSTTTDWYYFIWNAHLWANGSTWYLAVEGGTSAGNDGGVGIASATGCPSSCNFNGSVSTSAIIAGTGSPRFISVPDSSAVVLTSCLISRSSCRAWYSPTSNNLLLPGSWTLAPGFNLWEPGNNASPEDFSLAFSPTLGLYSFEALGMYSHGQDVEYQATARLTLDQWYAAITAPVGVPVAQFNALNSTGYSSSANVVYDQSPTVNTPVLAYPGSGNWNPFYDPHDSSMTAGAQCGLTADQNCLLGWFGHSGTNKWNVGDFGLDSPDDWAVQDVAASSLKRIDFVTGHYTIINAANNWDVRFNYNNSSGNGVTFWNGAASSAQVAVIDKFGAFQQNILYSAAGTALPTCNTAYKGAQLTVSDATSPTYLGTYTSGGTVVAPVFCNGSNWLTH